MTNRYIGTDDQGYRDAGRTGTRPASETRGEMSETARDWIKELAANRRPHSVTVMAADPSASLFKAWCRTCGEIGTGSEADMERIAEGHSGERAS